MSKCHPQCSHCRDERTYQAWLWLGGIVGLVVLAGWAVFQ